MCDLYLDVQALEQEGNQVVYVYEMTGIQALEHKFPDKLPLLDHPGVRDFEYIRHGTTGLIVNRKLLKHKSYTSIEELKESIQRFIE